MVRRALLPLCGLLILLAPEAGRAGDLLALYGGENVGTAGAQFLRLPVGARGVAMGRAYVACATDGAALFWNPAGILRSPARRNFFAAHTEYAAGIDLEHLSAHWRGQNFAYGISAGILRSGDIPRTTEFHQQGTGTTFRADQFFLGATVARAMTDRFSIGGTLKFYQENLDEFVVRSALVDLGILYFVGDDDLRIGFSVRNFGPDLRPGGTPPPIGPEYQARTSFQSFAAPTSGSFGVARTFALAEKIGLLGAAEFHHPSDYAESFRFGGELGLDSLLFLRAGYETNRDEGGFAAGFGVALSRDRVRLRADYAYSDMGSFGAIHHFSLDVSPLFARGPR